MRSARNLLAFSPMLINLPPRCNANSRLATEIHYGVVHVGPLDDGYPLSCTMLSIHVSTKATSSRRNSPFKEICSMVNELNHLKYRSKSLVVFLEIFFFRVFLLHYNVWIIYIYIRFLNLIFFFKFDKQILLYIYFFLLV